MVKPAAFAAFAHFDGESEGAEEGGGVGEADDQGGGEEAKRAGIEDDAGFRLFGFIALVDDLLIPFADGVAVDREAEGFEGVDLAADEGL